MTKLEAKKLAHEQYLALRDPALERALTKINMTLDQRKELGALFYAYASLTGIEIPYEPLTKRYTIKTCAGAFKTYYDPCTGTIFGRFENAEVAAQKLTGVNPHSGKWNTHTSKDDEPTKVFLGWQIALNHVKLP